MKCVICNKDIEYQSSKDASPLRDGRCCESCYTDKVIPALKRLERY